MSVVITRRPHWARYCTLFV